MAGIEDKICEHSGFCGGCTYQGTPYSEQLKIKEQEVLGLFRAEGIEPLSFDVIEGCSSISGYRNKMEYTFGDEVKDGPLCLGMHRPRQFMSITTVDKCQLVPADFNVILRATLDFCVDREYSKYHKRKHTGLLRNLVVRKGMRTGEIIVNIVTSSDGDFDDEAWKEELLGLSLDGEIAGIMHTMNDNIADSVNCDELKILYGKDYYNEKLLGLDFKVHEFSFFQTNIDAVERLYSKAISLIDSLEGKNVYDLYCGTGTISQLIATKARHVTGVEIVQESVDMAKENATLNGLSNCDFIQGDVFDVLDKAAKENALESPDVIVVDPPRVGMTPDAVQKISSYGVEQIVYISCNPKSLVRNLSQFQEHGYRVDYVKPYDNFPMTSHVECVTLMSRTDG